MRSENFFRSSRVAALVVAAAAACAGPTTVEQSWVAPTARAQPPMQRLATLFVSENATMRHSAEDRLAFDLRQQGIAANPSYAVLGDQLDPENLDKAKARLRQLGYDGVVVMQIVDREQEIESLPGYGGWGGWGWYGGYYGNSIYTETIYRMETSAYDLRTGRLVWSMLTRTDDPETARELIGTTSQVATRRFVSQGLSG
jgi:hypothetical protein